MGGRIFGYCAGHSFSVTRARCLGYCPSCWASSGESETGGTSQSEGQANELHLLLRLKLYLHRIYYQ
jgi:hypothetical protein